MAVTPWITIDWMSWLRHCVVHSWLQRYSPCLVAATGPIPSSQNRARNAGGPSDTIAFVSGVHRMIIIYHRTRIVTATYVDADSLLPAYKQTKHKTKQQKHETTTTKQTNKQKRYHIWRDPFFDLSVRWCRLMFGQLFFFNSNRMPRNTSLLALKKSIAWCRWQ